MASLSHLSDITAGMCWFGVNSSTVVRFNSARAPLCRDSPRTSIKSVSNEDHFPLKRPFKKWNYTGDEVGELPPLLFMSLWDVDASRTNVSKLKHQQKFSQATKLIFTCPLLHRTLAALKESSLRCHCKVRICDFKVDKEFPFILVRGMMAWLTEKHLKGNTKIASWDGWRERESCAC